MDDHSSGYADQSFVAEYYDYFYDAIPRRDIDYYVNHAIDIKGRTLELGCGTGRVLIPIAAAGGNITGLDRSPFMLRKCREKLAVYPTDVGSRVTLVDGDMTDFDLGELFDLIIMPFRAFQLLISDAAQKACMQCVNRHLQPEGLFVFDIYHPSLPRLTDTRYLMEMDVRPPLELPDGRILRRTNRTAAFHPEEHYNEIELIHYVRHPDGRQERLVHAFTMRYFYRDEMEQLLEVSGFEVISLYGNFDRSPFTEDSPEMIFVTRKAGR